MSKERDRQPVIFLIDFDDDTRPILKENLIRDGYRVHLALDEDDAMGRVEAGRLDADLILINLDALPDDVLNIARKLREHAKWDGQTPIVVISSVYPDKLVGKDVAISETEYVTYLEDPDQLQNLLQQLLP